MKRLTAPHRDWFTGVGLGALLLSGLAATPALAVDERAPVTALENLSAALSAAKLKVDTVQSSEELNQLSVQFKDQLKAVREQNNELAAKLAEGQNAQSEMLHEQRELAAEISDYERTVRANERQMQDLERKLQRADQRLALAQRTIAHHDGRRDELRAQLDSSQAQAAALREQAVAIERQLVETQRLIAATRDDLRNAGAARYDAKDDLNRVRMAIAAMLGEALFNRPLMPVAEPGFTRVSSDGLTIEPEAELALWDYYENQMLSEEHRKGIQHALTNAGYYRAAIDGRFGPGTRRSISAFQESLGAEPTGYLTADQHRALIASAGGPSADAQAAE